MNFKFWNKNTDDTDDTDNVDDNEFQYETGFDADVLDGGVDEYNAQQDDVNDNITSNITSNNIVIEYENKEMYDVIRYQDPFPPGYNIDFNSDLSDDDKKYIFGLLETNDELNGYSSSSIASIFDNIHFKILSDYQFNTGKININILDLGSGTGKLLDLILSIPSLSGLKINYTGVDFNENLINIAKYKFSLLPDQIKDRINIEFINAPIESFITIQNQPEMKYDLIFITNVFDYELEYITGTDFYNDYFVRIHNVLTTGQLLINILTSYYNTKLNVDGFIFANFFNPNVVNHNLENENDIAIADKVFKINTNELIGSLKENGIDTYEYTSNYFNLNFDFIKIKRYL